MNPLNTPKLTLITQAVLAFAIAQTTQAQTTQAQTTQAQTTPAPAPTPAQSTGAAPTTPTEPQSQTITITGNPFRSNRPDAATSVLQGDALLLRRGSTVAETLSAEPSVSSTWFGPSANRPTIRGLDGDRIRILNNSGASLDASSLSDDHAVPLDPLVIERLEVLRGPAALLYGGAAVGGVVNVVDNRIPATATMGTQGAVEMRVGGAARERAASALVEHGAGGLMFHADAFARRTAHLSVPRFDRPNDDGSTESRTQLANTASTASGGAAGVSYVGVQGHLGVSVETYRQRYGSVADEAITLDMKRHRVAIQGEAKAPWQGIEALRLQAANTRYQHQELEGSGEVGTVFRNRGHDGRVEITHAPIVVAGAKLQGVLGGQWDASDFSALGAEAFMPSTQTRSQAWFGLEKLSFGPAQQPLTASLGLRGERVRIACDDARVDAPRCLDGVTSRAFGPRSAAVSLQWQAAPAWTASGSYSATRRAPTSAELFANGVHVATAAFERGNAQLEMERSRQAEASLQWKQGDHEVKANVFRADFANMVLLQATGDTVTTDEGDLVPVFAYQAQAARLTGYELAARTALALASGSRLMLDAQWSSVRGRHAQTREPLPRIAPQRGTVGASWLRGAWTWRAVVQRAQAQKHVAALDTATPGWTMLNVSAFHNQRLTHAQARWFVKLTNATNALGYNASTISSVRALSPLPGRGLAAGLRIDW